MKKLKFLLFCYHSFSFFYKASLAFMSFIEFFILKLNSSSCAFCFLKVFWISTISCFYCFEKWWFTIWNFICSSGDSSLRSWISPSFWEIILALKLTFIWNGSGCNSYYIPSGSLLFWSDDYWGVPICPSMSEFFYSLIKFLRFFFISLKLDLSSVLLLNYDLFPRL